MASVPSNPFDVRMAMRIDRYASPEALACVASAPLEVCELLFFVTEGDRAHIALIRDQRGDSVTWEERYAIIWVARTCTNASFPEIGRAISKDHSVALKGFNKAKALRRDSAEFRAMTDALSGKLSLRNRVQKRARHAA